MGWAVRLDSPHCLFSLCIPLEMCHILNGSSLFAQIVASDNVLCVCVCRDYNKDTQLTETGANQPADNSTDNMEMDKETKNAGVRLKFDMIWQ